MAIKKINRKFNGLIYKYSGHYISKQEAEKQAKYKRSKGMNVRVVRLANQSGNKTPKYHYAHYIRWR